MTTPRDPYERPEEQPPAYGQQPGWGAPPPAGPPWGQQPQWGQQPGWGQQPPPGTNGMAIASLVTAIVCCSPLGIVLGLIAKSQIKKTGQGGDGLATAGIVVGAILTVFAVATLLSGDFTYDFSTSP